MLAVAILVGLVEGLVGWELQSPGGSLAIPCLKVGVIAVSVLLVGTWLLGRLEQKRACRAFVAASVCFGVVAVWWTYAFALPAAMAWDAGATPMATSSLIGAPANGSRCTTINSGSIGPMQAPFTQCASNASTGPVVFYGAVSNQDEGLAFVEGSMRDTLGGYACVRHLVGEWWAWQNAGTNCHLGYNFVPGPGF